MTESDADPALALLETDQTDRGLSLQLSETLGGFTISENVGWQESEDDFDPTRNTTVTNASLTLSGAVSERVTLFSQLGSTKTEQAAVFGSTTLLLAMLQPSISLRGETLLVQPYLSYNRTDSDISGVLETELYQLVLTWTPRRLSSHVGFQLANDWSRSRQPGVESPGFEHRFTGSLLLRWNGSGSGSLQPDPYRPPAASALSSAFHRQPGGLGGLPPGPLYWPPPPAGRSGA
jgi:hypothetical protein